MKGLTLTIITSRVSGGLNYGETFGNVSTLKKLTLGDNTQVVYVSDKALRYSLKRWLKENRDWRLMDEQIKDLVSKDKNKESKLDVDSFGKYLIKEYHEFDLFGGLFTNLKGVEPKKGIDNTIKRTSVAKLTYAFSLTPYKGDADFLNNIDAFNRYIKHVEDKEEQVIAYTEQHTAHYVYTLAVDLDRVGVWEKEDRSNEDVLELSEKVQRVKDLLDAVFYLTRSIKGRQENLSPIFVIGGVFSVKNPFFADAIEVCEEGGKLRLNTERLESVLNQVPEKDKVVCGMLSGFFANEEEIKSKLKCMELREAFETLKCLVKSAYGVTEVT
ncbi:MAG: type I-B CRISPR-associated protein Cas7/Cst2/DevR [Acidobacteria bacterium]|nr:MAG: type I-B CRISPR-associated protein Cas7/Cst2/DevR [Acidobacteriota bacterium]